MELGIKLKKARTEKGITQEYAAELLGVSRQSISNWENNKSYPDIISVIKMSDIYSISLDQLLKDKDTMKQTYQEFLEESTNTVKAKNKLSKTILISTYFIVWIVTMLVMWRGNITLTWELNLIFKLILLPTCLSVFTIVIGKNDDWGKQKWFCIIPVAISFFTVPCTKFVESQGTATHIFQFPNFPYMLLGIAIASCGIFIGSLLNRKSRKVDAN